MGYIESNLLPGETVIQRARLHWIVFLKAAAVFVLGLALLYFEPRTIGLVVAAIGMAMAVPPWLELVAFAATGCGVAYLHYFGMLLIGLETLAALLLIRRCARGRIALALVVLLPVVLAVWWLPWMSQAMTRRSYWPQPPSWPTSSAPVRNSGSW